MNVPFRVLAFGTCLAFLAGGSAIANDPPLLDPESTKPWDAGPGFDLSRKLRRSISGVACNSIQQQRVCLAVFDEEAEARHFTMTAGGYVVDNARVVLRSSGGELDAEGAATDDKAFYVTGSHSATRNRCDTNPDSWFVIRIARDPASGRALAEKQETSDLWSIMMSLPDLKAFVGDEKCLGTEPPPKAAHKTGQRGVNIEGLAIKDGRLHFGMRGPAQDGTTRILSVDAEALFAKKGATAQDVNAAVTTVTVGNLRGIRDLLARDDGILILAGPDDDASSGNAGWVIALWDGKPDNSRIVQPRLIGRLNLDKVERRSCDEDLKPEAMALIDEKNPRRLVILSDGLCDGGPLVFNLPE